MVEFCDGWSCNEGDCDCGVGGRDEVPSVLSCRWASSSPSVLAKKSVRRKDFPSGLLRRLDAIRERAGMEYSINCQYIRNNNSVAVFQGHTE